MYGILLFAAWWWMLWTPGPIDVPPLQPLNASQLELARELRHDVAFLASSIGERNIPGKPQQLEAAATFIDRSLEAAGYRPESQSYKVGDIACRNIEAAIRGVGRPQEIVILGAHYDTVPESPGADDNASGVATVLALARRFAGTRPVRTLRFVAFANEEPPYFWTGDMGSLVYAKKCKQAGDHVVAMCSIESAGFYSNLPFSQHYPAGLGLFFPATGNFVAFVGNLLSRPLVHTALKAFRGAAALPSVGAAVPNIVPGAGWSDHWSFWQQGFPGIEITDTAPYRNPSYHTPADTPERLDYGRMARFAWAMQTVVERLANPKL
jgi:hypothetical protein